MKFLKQVPYNLNDNDILWVEKTITSMSIEEKIGQLFFLVALTDDENYLNQILAFNPGGVMFRPLEKESIKKAVSFLEEKTKTNLFLAANLEQGGNGLYTSGTIVGNNMLIAATNEPENAYKQGLVCISEANEVGANMSFAPVGDINYNFLNPITNTRSYGDDSNLVEIMTKNYIKGVQDNGGISVLKHFPGDGIDGRDHHVVKTVNSLSFDKWMETYGKVYSENIDSGVESIMVGHIALPGFFSKDDKNKMEPASLSKTLLNELLRKKLNFNGLIITDATLMAGFMQEIPRKIAVPTAIAAGNDMFLFTKNLEEDFNFMLEGYYDGIITEDRLNEALTRILGLKRKSMKKIKNIIPDSEKKAIVKSIAEQAITLVRDDNKLLPIKKKRVTLINKASNSEIFNLFKSKLEGKGIEVTEVDLGTGMENPQIMMKNMFESIKNFKDKHELIIYVTTNNPVSNKVSNRIEYTGFEIPWFISEVDTILVSFGSPYNGYDFADIKTQVNSYCCSDDVVSATVDKLFGVSPFYGTTPVNMDYKYFNENEV